MIKYILIFIALVGLAWLLWPLTKDFSTPEQLNSIASQYVSGSVTDLNSPNVVTSIVVTYRGLDTLGEVTVLFLATAGVGFLLKKKSGSRSQRRDGSEILQSGAGFLAPLIMLFGVYVFTHGHLSPGGGFQGGVLIASGVLLMVMASTSFRFSHLLIQLTESLSGIAYVIIAILGVILLGANHFLDPRILPLGNWLSLFSAGAIPVIYSFLGLKVGAELSAVIESLSADGGEE